MTWGLGAQLISSVGNFLFAFASARYLSPRDLGAFTLSYTLIFVLLGLVRAIVVEPLAIRSGTDKSQVQSEIGTAAGAGLLIGVAATAISLAAVSVAPTTLRGPLVIFGIHAPLLATQELMRGAMVAQFRARSAALNDLLWTALTCAAIGLVVLLNRASPTTMALSWALPGSVAGLAALYRMSCVPSLPAAISWIARNRRLSGPFAVEFAATRLAGQSTLYIVAFALGLEHLGAFRAAQVLLSPINTLHLGVPLVMIPAGARLVSASQWVEMRRLVRRAVTLLGSAALICAAALLALPDALGRALIGDNWGPARDVLPYLAPRAVFAGVAIGNRLGLRVLARAQTTMRIELVTLILVPCAAYIGATTYGLRGAALGLSIASGISAVLVSRCYATAASKTSGMMPDNTGELVAPKADVEVHRSA